MKAGRDNAEHGAGIPASLDRAICALYGLDESEDRHRRLRQRSRGPHPIRP